MAAAVLGPLEPFDPFDPLEPIEAAALLVKAAEDASEPEERCGIEQWPGQPGRGVKGLPP